MTDHTFTVRNSSTTLSDIPLTQLWIRFHSEPRTEDDSLDYVSTRGTVRGARELDVEVEKHSREEHLALVITWYDGGKPMIGLPVVTAASPAIIVTHDGMLEQTTLLLKVPAIDSGDVHEWPIGGQIPGFALQVKVKRKA